MAFLSITETELLTAIEEEALKFEAVFLAGIIVGLTFLSPPMPLVPDLCDEADRVPLAPAPAFSAVFSVFG